MAGPLNGLGTGQQIPLSNTFQPGQTGVRQDETRKPQDNETAKTRNTPAASSLKSETDNTDVTRARQSLASNQNSVDPDSKRGSLLDITV